MSSWEPFPSAPEGCCTVAGKSSPRSSPSGNPWAIMCTGINANQTRCLQRTADVWVQEASLSFTLGHCLRSREWQQEQWPCNVPSPPATLGHPWGGSNLLWLSKGCARQLQRLPFSRQALQGVILRNPHLRLICRTQNMAP